MRGAAATTRWVAARHHRREHQWTWRRSGVGRHAASLPCPRTTRCSACKRLASRLLPAREPHAAVVSRRRAPWRRRRSDGLRRVPEGGLPAPRPACPGLPGGQRSRRQGSGKSDALSKARQKCGARRQLPMPLFARPTRPPQPPQSALGRWRQGNRKARFGRLPALAALGQLACVTACGWRSQGAVRAGPGERPA
eukprot:365811-Chlamydomonas_euryale.AAC.13